MRLMFLLAFLFTLPGIAQNAPSPPAGSQKQINVSPGVLESLLEHSEVPAYPREAIRAGIAGDAPIRVWISTAGSVEQCQPLNGDPILAAAGIEALRRFRFRPFSLNGEAINVSSWIDFRFLIRGTGDKAETKVEVLLGGAQSDFDPARKEVFVIAAKKVSAPEPQIDADLSQATGDVIAHLNVGPDGHVKEATVVTGSPIFKAQVLNAVRQWVYEPRLVLGTPAAFLTQESFHFGPK